MIRRLNNSIGAFAQRIRRHEVAGDVAGLYLIQAVQVLLPIGMIPYLARRLGPGPWGTVAFFQAVAMYLSLILEFGFGLSATRSIAQNRNSRAFQADSISGVTGAKLILLFLECIIMLVLGHFNHILRSNPSYLACAIVWGAMQGFNMVWYFQGLGQMRKLAFVEVSNRLIAAALTIWLVRLPSDGWKILLFNATGASFATVISGLIACRELNMHPLSWKRSWSTLREGFGLFLFRSAVSLYTMGNSLILGFFCPIVYVGYYAGAERISKGILSCVAPLNQTLYAQINKAFAEDQKKGEALAGVSTFLLTGLGAVLGTFLFLTAPLLVRLMLGSGYEPAILAVRIMSILPPLICLATSLGANWMLPLRFDRPFTLITALSGVLNITLAAILAPRFRHLGMCIAVTISELFVCIGFFVYLTAKGNSPLRTAVGKMTESRTKFTVDDSAEVNASGVGMTNYGRQ